jgi:putative intracellular protease/amidase
VLSRLPGADVTFAATEAGPVTTDTGVLTIVAGAALADVGHPEIIVVPGGPGTRDMLADAPLIDWLREVHEHTQWTTSVCTGSLLLAAAGILRETRATTHWAALELLGSLGATPVEERVVQVGKVITAAGVSAGIDMALTLAALVAGDDVAQAIQLSIEYDPQPPFSAGSVASAPPEVVELLRRHLAGRDRSA